MKRVLALLVVLALSVVLILPSLVQGQNSDQQPTFRAPKGAAPKDNRYLIKFRQSGLRAAA